MGEYTKYCWVMTNPSPPEERFVTNVGDSIRSNKRSVESVAKELGLAPSTLRYQLARPGTISLRNACKLRDALGVDL